MALTENKRFTFVQGPRKQEVIVVTSSNTDTATVSTTIQNPEYVTITGANGSPTASDVQVDVSGRTITVTAPDAEDYLITAYGF